MPRPRKWLERYTPEQVAARYQQGESTRRLERELGVSRWLVTLWVIESGRRLRDRDDALAAHRLAVSLCEDRDRLAVCAFPRCGAPRSGDSTYSSLCADHTAAVAVRGRECRWLRCIAAPALSGGGLCVRHQGLATGLLSD